MSANPNDTHLTAKPVLSYPPGILNLTSAWKDCRPVAYNLVDHVSLLAPDNGVDGNLGFAPVIHV